MEPTIFGKLSGQKEAKCYRISAGAFSAVITDLGATLVSLFVPDKEGNLRDVVLGFDTPDSYLNPDNGYMGAVVGRFCNRIKKGRFTLNGKDYTLETNNGPNHLHGGKDGFSFALFSLKEWQENKITLTHFSPDMEGGFPGNMTFAVTYEITKDGSLTITYEAASDKETPANFTNHAYFNLEGADKGSTVFGHTLSLSADAFCETDENDLVTGKILPTAGSEMDFSAPTLLSARLENQKGAIAAAGGIDHNFALTSSEAAVLASKESGIVMRVFTDLPGIQVYSAGQLKNAPVGKKGVVYPRFGAICLETQFFPDAPNNPHFPSLFLKPGETFVTKTTFTFSLTEKED